jgi:hypothetical protein
VNWVTIRERLAIGDNGVGSRQGQEAPLCPIPQFLSAGTKLIHLLPGVGVEASEGAEDLAGSADGSASLSRSRMWVYVVVIILLVSLGVSPLGVKKAPPLLALDVWKLA